MFYFPTGLTHQQFQLLRTNDGLNWLEPMMAQTQDV
jgi:hypothetical protein